MGYIARTCESLHYEDLVQRRNRQPIEIQNSKRSLQRSAQKQIIFSNSSQYSQANNKRIWQKKNVKNEDVSLIIQTALKAQKKIKPWILDSGCSSHMTGDKEKFDKLEQLWKWLEQ